MFHFPCHQTFTRNSRKPVARAPSVLMPRRYFAINMRHGLLSDLYAREVTPRRETRAHSRPRVSTSVSALKDRLLGKYSLRFLLMFVAPLELLVGRLGHAINPNGGLNYFWFNNYFSYMLRAQAQIALSDGR